MRATAAQEPLTLIRRLYDAWNVGDVAAAAEVLSPDVRWDTFGGGRAAGANAIQATLAGGSGGTWHMTAVAIDLLVGVVDHVIAFSRRSGAEPERIEIWTLRGGKAVHYRGYPLNEGLAVLSETTRSVQTSIRSGSAPLRRLNASTWSTTPTSRSIATAVSFQVPPEPPASVACIAFGPAARAPPKESQRTSGDSTSAAVATSPAFHAS